MLIVSLIFFYHYLPLTLTLSLHGEREFTVFGLNTVFAIARQVLTHRGNLIHLFIPA
jgi:hypothetical protein